MNTSIDASLQDVEQPKFQAEMSENEITRLNKIPRRRMNARAVPTESSHKTKNQPRAFTASSTRPRMCCAVVARDAKSPSRYGWLSGPGSDPPKTTRGCLHQTTSLRPASRSLTNSALANNPPLCTHSRHQKGCLGLYTAFIYTIFTSTAEYAPIMVL